MAKLLAKARRCQAGNRRVRRASSKSVIQYFLGIKWLAEELDKAMTLVL